MHKKLLIKFIFSVIVLLSISVWRNAHAAALILSTPNKTIHAGDTFVVDVNFNSDNETINAIQGVVTLSPSLTLRAVHDTESLVSFWVKEPTHDTIVPGGQHEITFSGLIPGGISASRGHLFSLLCQADASPIASGGEIKTTNQEFLLNDGFGTKTKATGDMIAFTIIPTPSEVSSTPPQTATFDTTPPDPFTPAVGRDPSMFHNHWFVAFAAHDTASGIDHYEIQEQTSAVINDHDWKIAVSPYVLTDQTLNSYIYVRAVDKQGNTRIEVIPPRPRSSLGKRWAPWAAVLMSMLLAIIVLWRISKTKKRQA